MAFLGVTCPPYTFYALIIWIGEIHYTMFTSLVVCGQKRWLNMVNFMWNLRVLSSCCTVTLTGYMVTIVDLVIPQQNQHHPPKPSRQGELGVAKWICSNGANVDRAAEGWVTWQYYCLTFHFNWQFKRMNMFVDHTPPVLFIENARGIYPGSYSSVKDRAFLMNGANLSQGQAHHFIWQRHNTSSRDANRSKLPTPPLQLCSTLWCTLTQTRAKQ